MTGARFSPDERTLIEATLEEGMEALGRRGIWLGSPGAVYLAHHREAVRLLRGALGRKPHHSEVADGLLAWARAEGDIRLYALRPLLVALALKFPAKGAEAGAIYPPLARAGERADAFIGFLPAHLGQAVA